MWFKKRKNSRNQNNRDSRSSGSGPSPTGSGKAFSGTASPGKTSPEKTSPRPASSGSATPRPASAIQEDINHLVDNYIDTLKTVMGRDAALDAESIRAMDEIISTHWPEDPPVMMDVMAATYGAFLGETIRRLHGGEWKELEDGTLALTDVGGIGMQIYPVDKAYKRFVNGEEDSIAAYYHVIAKMVKEGGPPA